MTHALFHANGNDIEGIRNPLLEIERRVAFAHVPRSGPHAEGLHVQTMEMANESLTPVSFHQTEGRGLNLLLQALHCILVVLYQVIGLAISNPSKSHPLCVLIDWGAGDQIVVFVPTTKIRRLFF